MRLSGIFGRGTFLLLLVACRPVHAAEVGAEVEFRLEKPGFVTVAIDTSEGKRVRNLMGETWLDAGRHRVPWNGLDDAGEPVPAATYRWKGLVHEGLHAAFEGAFNSPGNPPWLTAEISSQFYVRPSGSGGWLSDHAVPTCAFSDGERVYFGATLAEAGHAMMELTRQGEKTWGTLWLGLSGADALYRTNDILYVAGEKGWMKNVLAVTRLDARTHRVLANPPGSPIPKGEIAFIRVKSEDFSGIKGMVVTDRYIVLSLADRGRLALFDVTTGAPVRDIPLPGAGALVLLDGETVLAISGTTVVRLNLENPAPETVIDGSLVAPAGLAVTSQGDIVVSDVAPTEQVVKIFSPQGILRKTLGTPGGHREGLFNPTAMNAPRALAVDGEDHVWVGEHSLLPKRISVWSLEGQLKNSWTGPPSYGGGGTLDPEDSSRAFYKGMEFAVQPWPERSTLRAILFDPRDHRDLPIPVQQSAENADGQVSDAAFGGIPQAAVRRNGRLYLVHDQGFGVREIFIGEVVGNHLVPQAILGSVKRLADAWKDRHPDFVKSLAPENSGDGVFLWRDGNGDGRAEPGEVQVRADWRFGAMWAMRTWPTLNLHARTADGRAIVEIAPEPADDALAYDITHARLIPLPDTIKGITALAPDLHGNLLINTGGGSNQGDRRNMFFSIAPTGKINWTYPNPYPANWHNSPRQKPGNILHTLNVEGVVPLGRDRGDVFQLNGNKGVRYLLTTDGLFVGQLYGDMRSAPLLSSLHTVSRGQRVETFSLGDECFFGWLGPSPDGDVLQIVGKDSSNVMKVTGLETIRRLPGGSVTLRQAAEKFQAGTAHVPPIVPVQIAALGGGWDETQKHQRLDTESDVSFAIGYNDRGLTLKMVAKDARPFANSGDDPKTLFKTGDAVDFRISVAPQSPPSRTAPVPGDQRFLFSLWRGKPVAVRYRFVVPDTPESQKSQFASPTGTAVVDEVSLPGDVAVTVENSGTGWTVVAKLPWKALGLSGPPKQTLRGDVGLIEGDATGTRAVARHYYFDRGSQVVSDLPSEVRVNPSLWGDLAF